MNQKTKQKRNRLSPGTKKNKSSIAGSTSKAGLIQNFERKIVVKFLEILNCVKLYHWKTYSYATHKATDDLYSKLNENFDSFVEVLLGKGSSSFLGKGAERVDLISQRKISLYDMKSHQEFKNVMEDFKNFLVELNNDKALKSMTNTDLYNIRDEIMGNINQFLYLFTFS
jgi:DNA-binding ferritin-like protein